MTESQTNIGYIQNFYYDCENLINESAVLKNSIHYFKARASVKSFGELTGLVMNKSEQDSGLSENEKNDLVYKVSRFRLFAYRCFVKFITLRDSYSEFEKNKKIIELYKQIDSEESNYFLDPELVNDYVLEINKLFSHEVIRSQLESHASTFGQLSNLKRV